MNNHETQFIQLHPNGQSEWFCPECQYHVIYAGTLIVLDCGDPTARHGEITVLATEAEEASDPRLDFEEINEWLNDQSSA